MSHETKPIDEQVVVVTGASGGIGMAIAERAAEQGARVVLSARGKSRLETIAEQLSERGHEAMAVPADVTERDQLEQLAEEVEERFGGFDTWVNNAGVTIFGRLEETSHEDARRLFEVNYWGLVNGSEVALPYLRRRGGGVLINIGSALSDRSLPLQGHYAASKQAVRGYTNALRMELEHASDPIAVSLVMPGSVNSRYADHAKNVTDAELALPPPVYDPEVVARAVVDCAERPRRDLYVGAGGRAFSLMNTLMPRMGDWLMERTMFDLQKSDQPNQDRRRDTLYETDESEPPAREGTSGGGWPVFNRSLYTRVTSARWWTAAAGLALGAGAVWAAASS